MQSMMLDVSNVPGALSEPIHCKNALTFRILLNMWNEIAPSLQIFFWGSFKKISENTFGHIFWRKYTCIKQIHSKIQSNFTLDDWACLGCVGLLAKVFSNCKVFCWMLALTKWMQFLLHLLFLPTIIREENMSWNIHIIPKIINTIAYFLIRDYIKSLVTKYELTADAG